MSDFKTTTQKTMVLMDDDKKSIHKIPHGIWINNHEDCIDFIKNFHTDYILMLDYILSCQITGLDILTFMELEKKLPYGIIFNSSMPIYNVKLEKKAKELGYKDVFENINCRDLGFMKRADDYEPKEKPVFITRTVNL